MSRLPEVLGYPFGSRRLEPHPFGRKRMERHVCAACDTLVDDAHPSEWMCSNSECMIWFHVGGTDLCPRCGSEPLR